MPQYIKSHSNYVLKSFHQQVNDGKIYERDITTIGGVNTFPNGQTPIYRSNNFIITVRDDGGISNQYNRKKWDKNKTSGDTWTVTSLEGMVSEFEDDNDTKIVLKQDYYDFRDFAYYGSLSELFRASINDIIARFPGELYGTTDNVYYTTGQTIDGELIETNLMLGKVIPQRDDDGNVTGYTDSGQTLYYVTNPFGIDIHSASLPKDANPLKYFAENGYKNYDYINGVIKTQVTWNVQYETMSCFVKGDKLATITINGVTIYAYLGDDNVVYYLSSENNFHIRPNDTILSKFYNECDNFQKLLLNQKSTPKYKATFSVIKENENGYYREFEDFIFPTSEGDYNIDATSYGFNNYTSRLSEIGEFYDEYFTDNLYRSMTHEAIKNFDWTYTREFQEGDEEEYVLGGQKMQKALRVFAREFDEILSYINNINSVNRVTYDERNNLPDYFLTDTVENEGWNVVLVNPYYTNEAIGNLSNCSDVSLDFSQPSGSVTPYVIPNEKAYFLSCCSGGTQPCGYIGSGYYFVEARDGEYTKFDTCSGAMRNRIKRYTDKKEYTYQEVNNEFLRRLKLNSRYIWRHKGTLEGIDMILSMFGMRNKKFYDNLNNCQKNGKGYDYEITEYVAEIDKPICDNWDAVHQMYHIDWINSTKTITYDYKSVSNYNEGGVDVDYLSYQGLPIMYEQVNDTTRNLYPNFNKIEQYDGNPYFQMNGGWLNKKLNSYNFQFNVDDHLVVANDSMYKETVRNIRRFDTLQEMLLVPSYEIHDGQIVYVSKIYSNTCVVDGMVYEIKNDRFGRYIELVKQDDVVKAGDDLFFTEFVRVYNRQGEQQSYYLNTIPNGQIIKAYITSSGSFMCADDYQRNNTFKIITTDSTDTNYFKINDFSQSNRIDGDGWRRLKIDDCDYIKLSTIINDNDGNNPHNGMMIYDNGREYFKYFEQLFKYSIENDMFDERCYDNYELTRDTEISNIGWRKKDDETEDPKFTDYEKDDSYSFPREYRYYQSGNETRVWGKESGITVSYNVSKIHHVDKNEITNKVLNTKVIRITFRLHSDLSNNNCTAELKYIDDIVLNYLTQMIPSTAILQINYVTQ